METNSDNVTGGVTGAKRATYKGANPRELLSRIIAANSSAPPETWRRSFLEIVDTEREYITTILDWWLDNNIRAIVDERHARPKKSGQQLVQVKRRSAEMKVALDDHVRREAQLLLLDLVMPNGKPLAECTGRECLKFGGWCSALGKAVGNKRVRAVLSEGEVRKIWLSQR